MAELLVVSVAGSFILIDWPGRSDHNDFKMTPWQVLQGRGNTVHHAIRTVGTRRLELGTPIHQHFNKVIGRKGSASQLVASSLHECSGLPCTWRTQEVGTGRLSACQHASAVAQ